MAAAELVAVAVGDGPTRAQAEKTLPPLALKLRNRDPGTTSELHFGSFEGHGNCPQDTGILTRPFTMHSGPEWVILTFTSVISGVWCPWDARYEELARRIRRLRGGGVRNKRNQELFTVSPLNGEWRVSGLAGAVWTP